MSFVWTNSSINESTLRQILCSGHYDSLQYNNYPDQYNAPENYGHPEKYNHPQKTEHEAYFGNEQQFNAAPTPYQNVPNFYNNSPKESSQAPQPINSAPIGYNNAQGGFNYAEDGYDNAPQGYKNAPRQYNTKSGHPDNGPAVQPEPVPVYVNNYGKDDHSSPDIHSSQYFPFPDEAGENENDPVHDDYDQSLGRENGGFLYGSIVCISNLITDPYIAVAV